MFRSLIPDDRANSMHRRKGCHGSHDADANFFRRRLDAEAAHVRQRAIERRHGIPEAGLRAADAAMPNADGPVGRIVPLNDGTVILGGRSLAAHLVEAPALPMALIAPLLHKLTGVVVRAARAVVMNAFAV